MSEPMLTATNEGAKRIAPRRSRTDAIVDHLLAQYDDPFLSWHRLDDVPEPPDPSGSGWHADLMLAASFLRDEYDCVELRDRYGQPARSEGLLQECEPHEMIGCRSCHGDPTYTREVMVRLNRAGLTKYRAGRRNYHEKWLWPNERPAARELML